MLEHTRQALQELGLRHATVQQMDATQLDLDLTEFSHVLSSFSVFFFPELEQLLLRLHRELRTGRGGRSSACPPTY
jgi:ubiquinone/menaquinone biosynthesis C-methylase UbiE